MLMRVPDLTMDEIKITVEQPDLMTIQCDIHIFYVKNIEGKGKLLVYAKLSDEDDKSYDVQCADWLIENK